MTTKCFICLASCGRYCIIAVINYSTNQRGARRSGIRFRHQPSKQLSSQYHHHHHYAIFIILTFVFLLDERRFRWICSQNTHHPNIYLQLSSHSPCAIIIFSEQRLSEHDTFLACKLLYNWYNDFTIFKNGKRAVLLLVQCQLCALYTIPVNILIERFVYNCLMGGRMDGELPPIITIKEISKIHENLL